MSNGESFFEKCLKLDRIKPFSRGKVLVPKELALAKEDLKRASDTFKRGDWKWATVQTYYAMFHTARALLYAKNYREKSHTCLVKAIREFYVKEGKMGYWLVEAMWKAKTLREDADYYGECSKEGAEDLLKKAQEFLNTANKILKRK